MITLTTPRKTFSFRDGFDSEFMKTVRVFLEFAIASPSNYMSPSMSTHTIAGLEISAPVSDRHKPILSPEACAFVAELAKRFEPKRQALLQKRVTLQARLDAGEMLDFLPETQSIREGDWKVAPIPKDLLDRRVEITGPVEPKMVINALNSGAKVFMADFEDSLAPSWDNVLEGQLTMQGAINRTLRYTAPDTGKEYKLNDTIATLIVRPRGWHLDEKHVKFEEKPVAGALVDFGFFFFHNAKNALDRGTGPYFYLPKLESHEEAALWAEIFTFAEDRLGIKHGSIKATVLIETINAAFQMHEILHALRDYCVGLNCGRWDYIFSFIKKFRKRTDFLLPERGQVKMTVHFLRSYSQLLIQTCHKRGAFAMGGMAAQIPVKNDEEANKKAFDLVRADKEREAGDGHDGTWVAHPGLVPVAMEIFDKHLHGKQNQLDKLREDVKVTAKDLVVIPDGSITEAGMRNNINVSLQYLAAWLNGNGCVPIHNLMEDAATAEIARTQLWQWVHHPNAKLDNGTHITRELFRTYLEQEQEALPGSRSLQQASIILQELVEGAQMPDFLTLGAYELLA